MSARKEQLDIELMQIKANFADCDNVVITHRKRGIIQCCSVTYKVNGYIKNKDSEPELVNLHRVSIMFPLLYPKKPPIIKFLTPLWHPLVKNGKLKLPRQIYETHTLSQIISLIGEIIQHKDGLDCPVRNKNAFSWAQKNQNLLPSDNLSFGNANRTDEPTSPNGRLCISPMTKVDGVLCKLRLTKGYKAYRKSGFSIKTVLTKTLLWAAIGSIAAFGVIQLSSPITSNRFFAWQEEYYSLAEFFKYSDYASDVFTKPNQSYKEYCAQNKLDTKDSGSFISWYVYDASKSESYSVEEYLLYNEIAINALETSFRDEFKYDFNKLETSIHSITIISESIPFVLFACVLTFFITLGEGIYFGSKRKALLSGVIAAAVSGVLSAVSSIVMQWIYVVFINEDTTNAVAMFVRASETAILGLIIALTCALTLKRSKQAVYYSLFGAIGGFISGLFFNFIKRSVYDSAMENIIIYVTMGLVIGLCLAVMEQIVKTCWITEDKRGLFSKEFILFSRKMRFGTKTTNHVRIKNSLKLDGRHFVIIHDKNKYVLLDLQSKLGTFVNGERVQYAVLENGDVITAADRKYKFNIKQK